MYQAFVKVLHSNKGQVIGTGDRAFSDCWHHEIDFRAALYLEARAKAKLPRARDDPDPQVVPRN